MYQPISWSSVAVKCDHHFLDLTYILNLALGPFSWLWLGNMDPAGWLSKKDPGFQNQVPEETSLHLFLGAQDQRLGAEQDQLPCGSTETSSGTVKRLKLAWFRHDTHHNSLSKTILQGTLEGGLCRGGQRKCWTDNVKEWTQNIGKFSTRSVEWLNVKMSLWGVVCILFSWKSLEINTSQYTEVFCTPITESVNVKNVSNDNLHREWETDFYWHMARTSHTK